MNKKRNNKGKRLLWKGTFQIGPAFPFPDKKFLCVSFGFAWSLSPLSLPPNFLAKRFSLAAEGGATPPKEVPCHRKVQLLNLKEQNF